MQVASHEVDALWECLPGERRLLDAHVEISDANRGDGGLRSTTGRHRADGEKFSTT